MPSKNKRKSAEDLKGSSKTIAKKANGSATRTPEPETAITLLENAVAALEVERPDWSAFKTLLRRAQIEGDTDSAVDTTPFPGRNGSCLHDALCRLGVEYRWDSRAQEPQIRRPLTGNKWEKVNDLVEEQLRNRLAETFCYRRADDKLAPFYYGREVWKTSLFALLHDAQVDPFAEWLAEEVGAHRRWDRKERLGGWLGEVFDIDPCCPASLVAWAGRYPLIGAIRRCLTPGEKLDEVPVLVGGQGIGKSTMPKLLFPMDCPFTWVKDGLDLSGTGKERVEATLGAVIVEVSEMAGSTRAEIESLKAYVTRQHDNVRLAYRHHPEHLPRKFVLIGTTNSRTSLPNDPTGNRRFVPIDLSDGSAERVRNYLDANRMQLWLEALECVHGGAEARLPDHMKGEAKRAAEAHRRRDDILEDRLAAFVENNDGFTTAEAALACGFGDPPHRAEEMRVAAALQVMGFARRRARRADGYKMRWFAQEV